MRIPGVVYDESRIVSMDYVNYRHEYSHRLVIPELFWFGSTQYHDEDQWIMTAWDVERGVRRDFALRNCDFQNHEWLRRIKAGAAESKTWNPIFPEYESD